MAITKVTSGLISADASSIDLNIDAGTLYLDVSENRVGIGTTSPAAPLHVIGDIVTNTRVATDTINGYTGGSTPLTIQTGGAQNVILGTNGAERMRIDSSGAVGIGQVPETARWSGHDILQVGGRATFLGNDTVTSTGQTVLLDNLYYDASGTFQHRGDSRGVAMQFVEGKVILSNSNQTTGTPTVSERMRIESDGNLRVYDVIDNIANTLTLNGRNTGQIYFQSGGSEKMRLDSSGNLLVGKTTTAIGTTGISFSPNGLSTFSRSAGNPSLGLSTVGAGGKVASFYLTSSEKGYIEVTSSATNYISASDYRLKENVDYDFNALDRVAQLKPARFNFIADADMTVDGFLAHEVQDIVPQAVSGEKDAVDDEGNPKYQGIDQSKLVPLLTKAIQEQQTIIDNLKTRIEALEG